MIHDLLNYIYPIAFTGCSIFNKYLVPCKDKVKLVATSSINEMENADKIAYFPLIQRIREYRIYSYCGNVGVPRYIDLTNISKTSEILKARTLNPIIAKGVDNPEYEEIETSPLPVFAYSYGKPRSYIKIEKDMDIGFVNYFGGLGYIINSNLHILRNMKLDPKDIMEKDIVVNRSSKVYYELYDEEVFVEDITDLGLEGLKMLETKLNLKFKIEKIRVYNIAKELRIMKDPLAGDFNIIVIGKRHKVEDFLEKFVRLNIPCYIGGKVV